jgi:hypothetical protein
MVHDLLATTFANGATLPPVEGNIDRLIALAVDAAEQGDPCAIAERHKDGHIITVGCVLWLGIAEGFKRTQRTLYGLGTYVIEGERRNGVSGMLRDWATAVAKECGYELLVGAAHGEAALAACLSNGMRPIGTMVEKVL